MPIEMRTTGLNWRQVLRETNVFVCLVTPAWHRDRRCQRQLAYARELGRPITFLVKAGTRLPPMREGETALPWASVEECAALVARIESPEGPSG